MTTVAWVAPDLGIRGIIDASATHNPCIPLTLQYWSTTDVGSESGPILQVPDTVPGCSHDLAYPAVQSVVVAQNVIRRVDPVIDHVFKRVGF